MPSSLAGADLDGQGNLPDLVIRRSYVGSRRAVIGAPEGLGDADIVS